MENRFIENNRYKRIGSGPNTQPINWQQSLLKFMKQSMPFLLMAILFISCSEIGTVDEKEAQKNALKIEVSSQSYLSEGNLYLAEPEFRAPKNESVRSQSKATATRTFKQVLVHPKGEVPGSKGAPVVSNFADAIDRVKSGGTIRVFEGEYVLDEIVIIDRPVTIEPMGSASPVIRNTKDHAFVVSGDYEGMVIFKDLTFENPGGHSSIVAEGTKVLISGSTFDVMGGSAGAFAWQDAKLTIEESNISNGAVGAFASGENTNLAIRSSSFNNHNYVTVQYQFGADGIVEENSMTDCGEQGCARAFLGSQVSIDNNYFSDDISASEVDGFFHHIVIYIGATGQVTGNLFNGCGHGQCVAGIDRAALEISDNEFRIYEEHETRFVIVGSDGTGGNDPEGREVDITVKNNIIKGIGGNSENDPGNPDAYAIKLGGLLIENFGRMEAYGNTVENANMGISVLNGGVLTNGKDNQIRQVRTGVAAYDFLGLGQSHATLQSSDFRNYHISVLNDTFTTNSDLTCNWWGTTAGPQNPQGGQSSVALYNPWATESVAGSSVTNCNGGI